MTHTPGPWAVAESGYGWDHFAAVLSPTGIVATCHIAALSRDHEQTAADARLIAAAPELLEALQHAAGIIEAHVPRDALGMGGDPQDGQWPLLDEYLHHMKRAIAKATPAA